MYDDNFKIIIEMFNLSHKWSDIDTIYELPNSSTTLSIGAGSYSNNLKICDFSPSRPYGSEAGTIEIKRFTSIADQVSIHLFGNHDLHKITTSPLMPIIGDYQKNSAPETSETVLIGNDVWIGSNALILSNVNVGDGVVIGANCVVSKDVPPYAVVVGNPMRIIKFRFDESTILQLLKIRWWEWSSEKILMNANLLMSRNIEDFVRENI